MAKHKNYFYANATNQAVLGQFGLRVLKAGQTSPEGETYVVVEADIDSVFSCDIVANEEGEIGDTSFDEFALKEARMKYGRFENIEVISGQITAYKG